MFCKVRWSATEGKPVCPHCGGLDAYDCPPHRMARRGSAAGPVKADFTITSGTLFA